jgi:hypothetical protein
MLSYNNFGTGITNRTPRSYAYDWALASYLGRVNYVYDDRYLFTFTLRADGSSKFGDGNKWGYFLQRLSVGIFRMRSFGNNPTKLLI